MEKEFKGITLKIDTHSLHDTIEKLNELNEALKKAKSLIDELAKNKIFLELKVNDLLPVDLQDKFL
ncbi:MAG: hypothetical protein OGM09_01200 [Fusobacterium varium]|nr:hypothetical protein [Fusobacterium varium]UYI78868.1 MAG: hypothetical protein OGM09_01200 [Fusobacterium varium]